MAKNVVNLDALIPREDFAVMEESSPAVASNAIDIHNLDSAAFFATRLRKPDFQRETAHWSPNKVVDLIKAFIDGDLIPAVVLWQAGGYIFVIDGAHRLSALMSWVRDDYGDGNVSAQFFDNQIPEDQKRIATRTRRAVNTEIGAYAAIKAAVTNPQNVAPDIQKRASRLATSCIILQWVSAKDAQAAEKSFFKINLQAVAIDPTERRILQARTSANAIAARAITRAGTGHKYWSDFSEERQKKIAELGAYIHKALYIPPMQPGPIKTLDLPVAGQGYNTLPFIFDLVNQSNDIKIVDSSRSNQVEGETLPKDEDGSKTLECLGNVKRYVDRITGLTAKSFGLHPAVYFYSRSGSFQPTAFFAVKLLFEWLESNKKLDDFVTARAELEGFLIRNKQHLGHIVHHAGSGNRSLGPLFDYFKAILDHVLDGKRGEELERALKGDSRFEFLFVGRPPNMGDADKSTKKAFNRNTKSAAFFNQALEKGTNCQICGGRIHVNSIQIDHDQRKRDGGSAGMQNAQITHPYCNSTYKN